jgi:hypothetical protein
MQLAFKENTEIFCIFIFSLFVLKHIPMLTSKAGVDPGFQVKGAHLKKLRRAEGGANIFWVFRVKNHDFAQKNHIFSNFNEGGAPGAPPAGSAPRKGPNAKRKDTIDYIPSL